MPKPNSIDAVIAALNAIIQQCKNENNPLGYFAALYQQVSIKVREGIANNYFDDGPRMEKLDVIFANRYLDAFDAYHKNTSLSLLWNKASEQSKNYRPIVLQHLLLGIHAHISLDLGVAAAEISGNDLPALKNNFDKINALLSLLVNKVQDDLAKIWPSLKIILQKTKNVKNFFIDFSMQLSRDGAWEFAESIAGKTAPELEQLILLRDQKVVNKFTIITSPGFIASVLLFIIRIGEKGTVAEKIENLGS